MLDEFDGARLIAHLADHGAEVGEVKIRYGAVGEGRSLYMAGPEGNTVELKAP